MPYEMPREEQPLFWDSSVDLAGSRPTHCFDQVPCGKPDYLESLTGITSDLLSVTDRLNRYE